jgi:predicted CXXCH cytochrome family protein
LYTAALIAVSAFLIALLWETRPAYAQEPSAPAPDAACKMCHVGREGEKPLASGETLSLGVNLQELEQSVHGEHAGADVYCTDCHRPRRNYVFPHAENPAQSLHEFQANIAQSCEQCHTSIQLHNPGHLLADEDANAPNCVDCHGGHDVAPVAEINADPIAFCESCHTWHEDPRVQSAHNEIVANLAPDQTCETCHAATPQSTDAQCKVCHSLLSRTMVLHSGDIVELNVDPQDIIDSVHGARMIQGVRYTPLQCTDCHTDQAQTGFPHPQLEAENRRDLTLQMEAVCESCHADIAELNHDGVHTQAIEEGKLAAATCFDCHGNHAIHDPNEPRERVSQTCGNCHVQISEQYSQSVHGAALIGEDNPDVPVCIDCHGVHNIENPTTAVFRANSPDLCGGCHADATVMSKYDISTDVFDTYVADFHGATVELFERQHPNQETNKAVCYDCHGVHNILPTSDENSRVIKQNLLTTCRQCHPDATDNFPASWTSHFKPSLENNTLVYLVDTFYAIFIPTIIGGFLVFIGADIFRRISDRFLLRRRRKDES